MFNQTFRFVLLACAAALAALSSTGRVPALQTPQVQADPPVQVRLASIFHEVDKGGLPDTALPPLKAGKKMIFGLVFTNTSSAPVKVLVFDTYTQNRPQLLKEGQLVPYRDEVRKLVTAKEEPLDFGTRVDMVVLQPDKPQMPEHIDLAHWYDPLPPGHYELSLQHRFQVGQKWIDCSSVTFDVVP